MLDQPESIELATTVEELSQQLHGACQLMRELFGKWEQQHIQGMEAQRRAFESILANGFTGRTSDFNDHPSLLKAAPASADADSSCVAETRTDDDIAELMACLNVSHHADHVTPELTLTS